MHVCVCVCTDHAAALLAAVQPGCSAPVQRASALVQTLTARLVVTAGTAEQIFIWVAAVTGSPPAVRLSILHNRRQEEIDLKRDRSRNAVRLLTVKCLCNLIWLARWTFPKVLWIFFMCPSGEEPIKNIWKGEEKLES